MNSRKIARVCIALIIAGGILAGAMASAQTSAKPPAKLELNKATAEQLSKCPGLTPVLAKAIVAYRDQSGPFKAAEDLLKVKGVTKEILNKLSPKVDKGILYVAPAAPSSNEDEEEPSLKPSKC
jgi:competence ComEA-like helix-hairpin-helix protein